MSKLKVIVSIIIVLTLFPLTMSGSVFAASTTKVLSTNFTLVNLGTTSASVVAEYYKTDGSTWTAADSYSSFTIAPDGGQKIVRQYDSASGLESGQGSVVISSSQPLGAVVQILARGQVPTSGAYNGVSSGSNVSYLPLLQKQNRTASGLVNSQIIVQNTESTAQDPAIVLRGSDGSTFTKNITNLQGGASYYYDLADETGLPNNWVGSATVTGTGSGTLAVVSNMFMGPNGMQTYNAFPTSSATSEWFFPLLTSRLTNGQSGAIALQNVSGGEIPANDLQLTCNGLGSSTPATITAENPAAIANYSAFYFNPVTNTTDFPTNWYGSCRLFSKTSKAFVAFGQIRYTNGVGAAAAYEGIPGNIIETTLYVPLVMKRLSNGQATTAAIQNLSTTNDATVTLLYTPSAEYIAAGGSSTPITISNIIIPAGNSISRNYRLSTGGESEPSLPLGWYGTLKVTSDQPVQAMIQITNLSPSGDPWMAHLGFVK